MIRRRGASLLLLLLLLLFSVRGRPVLFSENQPAFFMEEAGLIPVALGEGFQRQGIYQFSDGSDLEDVIALTGWSWDEKEGLSSSFKDDLKPGEALSLRKEGSSFSHLERFWMTAGQRIALGIPLHPDQMSQADWEALPGIGPHLSETIEEDRQRNGDFGSLEHLERVRGIGPKRIEKWREFFLIKVRYRKSGEKRNPKRRC